MSNLIITIIAIALVAIAALMGAYYGGAAFLQGNIKAKANAIIEQANQIAGAWRAYTVDHNGDNALPLGFSSLIPNYIAASPVSPVGKVTSANFASWSRWGAAKYGQSDTNVLYVTTNLSSAYNTLVLLIQNKDVCDELNSRFGFYIIYPIALGDFGSSGTLMLTAGDIGYCIAMQNDYVFILRVF